MTAISTATRPLALLVEDDEPNRKARANTLEQGEFTVISVGSKDDADRELQAGPSFDIVITDVNLIPNNPTDISGAYLAREIHSKWPELPIVGYSGKFREGDARLDRYAEVFLDIHLRGSENINRMIANIERWHHEALRYREMRIQKTIDRLRKFGDMYDISEGTFRNLRVFIPGSQNETHKRISSRATIS